MDPWDYLEPSAAERGKRGALDRKQARNVHLYSQAISLKRIADSLEKIAAKEPRSEFERTFGSRVK